MKMSPETLVQMKVLQKPARNEYNTKQQKTKKQPKKPINNKKQPNLPKAVNQITWCFTTTKQRRKEERHEKLS